MNGKYYYQPKQKQNKSHQNFIYLFYSSLGRLRPQPHRPFSYRYTSLAIYTLATKAMTYVLSVLPGADVAADACAGVGASAGGGDAGRSQTCGEKLDQ